MGLGWTTASADQGFPLTDGIALITCSDWPDSGQNGHRNSLACSSRSSPVMTHERVMGSLRSSIVLVLYVDCCARSKRVFLMAVIAKSCDRQSASQSNEFTPPS